MEIVRPLTRVLLFLALSAFTTPNDKGMAQALEKMRFGYTGTGSNYDLEIGKRLGLFRRNGIDLEIVYVSSGSLLTQALIAGTFDVVYAPGSDAVQAKMRGADMRIVAVTANRLNQVFLTIPSITSFKQLKGKKVAVSRFGSGSHFQTNLVLKQNGLEPDKDVAVLQIGNSGARMTAISRGVVDGTVVAADFVPKAKKEGLNILADLAKTKIEYPILSLDMMGPYIDRNFKLVKALIRSMSESIRALQSDSANAKIAVRAALKTDDVETIDFALSRGVRLLNPRPFPTVGGIQTVLDEVGKEAKGKTFKFEDFVDMRALNELEREGFFK